MPLQSGATKRLQKLADEGRVRFLARRVETPPPSQRDSAGGGRMRRLAQAILDPLLKRRILIAVAHEGFIRNFRDVIVALAGSGVHVLVAISKQHHSISIKDYDFLSGARPVADVVVCEDMKNVPLEIERFRILRDILHLASPAFEDASDVRDRFADQQGGVLSKARIARLQMLAAGMPAARRDHWIKRLDAREAATPPGASWLLLLKTFQPHLVVVSPYVHYGSREVGLIKAARKRRVPSLLAVASWDNLTNKGVMKVRPNRVAVWNEAMANEAVSLHGVGPEQVSITGAPVFDRWFSREPCRSRDEFCEALGLRSNQKIILYMCSSHSITGGAERAVVSRVLDSVRTSSDKFVLNANFLIRPHPMALNIWAKFSDEATAPIGTFKSAIVWPIAPKHPTSDETDEAYFETLYYADAIVGLNTSAMIEAAILNKPVLTFVEHEAGHHQTGNLHFRHLVGTGIVRNFASVGSLVAGLEAYFDKQERLDVQRTASVVQAFVRPISRERSGSSSLAALMLHLAGVQSKEGQIWLDYRPVGEEVEAPRRAI